MEKIFVACFCFSAHPLPEYTSIVIRQTLPSPTFSPQNHDIEEVAIESLPEMVTELFDSIPQSELSGGKPTTTTLSSSLQLKPVSALPRIANSPVAELPLKQKELSTSSVINAATSIVHYPSSPIILATDKETKFTVNTPSIKPRQDGLVNRIGNMIASEPLHQSLNQVNPASHLLRNELNQQQTNRMLRNQHTDGV